MDVLVRYGNRKDGIHGSLGPRSGMGYQSGAGRGSVSYGERDNPMGNEQRKAVQLECR